MWASIIVKESGVGIDESAAINLGVYPNPAFDMISIKGFTGEALVYNLAGKCVLTVTTPIVDVRKLTKGIYIIENQGVKTKFIKE